MGLLEKLGFTARKVGAGSPADDVNKIAAKLDTAIETLNGLANVSSVAAAAQTAAGAATTAAGAATTAAGNATNAAGAATAAASAATAQVTGLSTRMSAAEALLATFKALLGSEADVDLVVNRVPELLAVFEQFPEGAKLLDLLSKKAGIDPNTGLIYANLLPVAAGGTAPSNSDSVSDLGLDIDENLLGELITYAADGTTIESVKLTLNMPEIINEVRAAITGSVTPSPTGDKQNISGPTGSTFDFLRLQSFVPPAGFAVEDMEYAYEANLDQVRPYKGAIDLGPDARQLGYLNGRIKGTTTRNPSAWTKSLPIAAALAQPVNYLPYSVAFSDHASFGNGAFDAGNTSLAPDGTMTAMHGRNYSNGIIGFPQATGLVNGNTYDISVFVKPDDVSIITGAQLYTNDNEQIAVFKFLELQATAMTSTMRSATIQDMSTAGESWSGWYKLDMAFQLQGNAINFLLRLFGGYGGVWVWAPQINDGQVRTATLGTNAPISS
jgi:hypothetical protein